MALGRTSTAAYYWTILDNGRCGKIWVSPFLVRSVHPKGQTELILTLKVETIEYRHPVGGPFGCELSAFVIIAEL